MRPDDGGRRNSAFLKAPPLRGECALNCPRGQPNRAAWPSGKATDCKSVIVSSILTAASNKRTPLTGGSFVDIPRRWPQIEESRCSGIPGGCGNVRRTCGALIRGLSTQRSTQDSRSGYLVRNRGIELDRRRLGRLSVGLARTESMLLACPRWSAD